MSDREKVIKGLECLSSCEVCYGSDCPYYNFDCTQKIAQDVLELLKEQEPKIGYWVDSAGDDKCSVCGATYNDLYPDYQNTHYCPNCGAKMTAEVTE